MAGTTALIYRGEVSSCSYGPEHPFKPLRYRLAHELMLACGVIAPLQARSDYPLVSEEELLAFHSADYLERLREFSSSPTPRADFRYGLGDAENPVFPGMYEWAVLGASGTAEAARLVLDEGYRSIFHLAGGWHHAHAGRASGFSYLNDAVLAINRLLARGKRVVYLDFDAHHGDGVQEAYYDTDQVLTISLHQSGIYFFPGTGFEHETGVGAGKGYAVNIPFLEHAGDAEFTRTVEEVVVPLIAAYAPDVLVTQVGADAFRTDPLTLLEITTNSYLALLHRLKVMEIPWIALAGGGYDHFNVARAWTLVWAVMNDRMPAPELPEVFLSLLAKEGEPVPSAGFFDPAGSTKGDDRASAALEQSILRLRQTVFPIITGGR